MKRLTLILAVSLIALIAQAVGPKVPCVLTFTPSPSAGVTGYWLYWRAPAEFYSDSRRIGLATNAAPFDMRSLGLARGDYFISMSATNAQAESELSDECLWHFSTPARPSAVFVQ